MMSLLKYALVPLLKIFVKESSGFAHVPRRGPAILAANHASYIDGPLVALLTDWHCGREPVSIQSREWLEKSWLRKLVFVTMLRQIPTDGSVAKALDALRAGRLLLFFPEGHRTSDGTIQESRHTGLGVLASLSKAPIVPIGIEGSYAWWPRKRSWPTFKPRSISVRAGKPLRYRGARTRKACVAFQHAVMHKVAKLARTTYRK